MTQARVIKLATDDGLFEFNRTIPLGHVYDVDLVHARLFDLYNIEKQVHHEKVLVKDLNRPGWLPLECLEVES